MATIQLQAFALVALGIRHPWLRPRQPASMQADRLQLLLHRPLQPLYRNVFSSKAVRLSSYTKFKA